jgi:hypothetical protein
MNFDLAHALEEKILGVIDVVASKHKHIREIEWQEALDEALAIVVSMRLDELEEERDIAQDEEE